MPTVSHSEVESFLSCKRKHYYGYELSLAPRDTAQALNTGTAGHRVLERFYRTCMEAGSTWKEQNAALADAYDAARAEWANILEEGYEEHDDRKAPLEDILFKYYFPHEMLVSQGWLIKATEQEYVLEYEPADEQGWPESKRFPFVIDLFAISPEGKTVVVDFKFLGRFYSDEDVETMTQLPKYIGGLRALGYRVDQGAYLMLNKTKVVGEKLKKDELVKVLDADPKLTVAVLTDMAIERGIQVAKGPTPEQAMRWLDIKPNSTRVQRTFLEQIGVADEILTRKHTMSPKQQDETAHRVGYKGICAFCDFRLLCTTELSGGNTKLLLQTEYKIRERRAIGETSEEVDED